VALFLWVPFTLLCKRKRSKGKGNKVVVRARNVKSLKHWEKQGRIVRVARQNNAGADDKEQVVLGVSVACMRMFLEENNVGSNWTMAQLCERVIKHKTLFETELGPISGSGGGAGRKWSQGVGKRLSDARKWSSSISPRLSDASSAKLVSAAKPGQQKHCAYAQLLIKGSGTDALGVRFVGPATQFLSYRYVHHKH
jgi:hypothetical protein